MLSLRHFINPSIYQYLVTLQIVYLLCKNLMFFTGLHLLVASKNILEKPIEDFLWGLANVVQSVTNQCTKTEEIVVQLTTMVFYLHFQIRLPVPLSLSNKLCLHNTVSTNVNISDKKNGLRLNFLNQMYQDNEIWHYFPLKRLKKFFYII